MNPASHNAKRALIKTLNEDTLDPNTGEQSNWGCQLSALRASCGRRFFLHASVSLSLWKGNTQATSAPCGCASEPDLEACSTAREE
jgi:hypothetical protein